MPPVSTGGPRGTCKLCSKVSTTVQSIEGEDAENWMAQTMVAGSVGPLVFVQRCEYAYSCGAAHPNSGCQFTIWDLASQETRALAEVTGGVAFDNTQMGTAREALAAYIGYPPEELAVTGLWPNLTEGEAGWTYRLTTEACYACSDDAWSSYTASALTPGPPPPALDYPDICTKILYPTLWLRTVYRSDHGQAHPGSGSFFGLCSVKKREGRS